MPYLPPETIEAARMLDTKGFTRYRIGKSIHLLYGFNRTTIYSHLNDDPKKYQEKPRNPKERQEAALRVRELKNKGLLSTQVAEVLALPLVYVNKLWC